MAFDMSISAVPGKLAISVKDARTDDGQTGFQQYKVHKAFYT